MIDAAFDVGADFHVLAATGRPHFLDPGHIEPEAHAARAMNAARHVRGDQRTQVLVLDHALALGEARDVAAETQGQVLQLALPALIADRAVERVVDEQKFHRRALRTDGLDRVREDLHALGHRRRASRQRFGRFLDFDQAHAAVGHNRQLVVIAESRDVNALAIGHTHDGLILARLDRDAIDRDIDLLKSLYQYTPKVGVLLTKADLVSEPELREVVEYVRAQLAKSLSGTPRVFPYSTRPGFERFREALEAELVGGTLERFAEERESILLRKMDTLLRECADYLALSLRSAETARAERQALKQQVTGEKEIVDEVKSAVRLVVQHA